MYEYEAKLREKGILARVRPGRTHDKTSFQNIPFYSDSPIWGLYYIDRKTGKLSVYI
jgi:hypothetical protein